MSKGSGLLSISPFLPKSFSNCLRWCVSGGLAIVILSFQEPFLAATAPGMQAAAQATEETVFPDNTASFETTDDEVRAVKDILINQVRAGYREFDLSLIEPLLAPDFQRRTIISKDEVLIETREDYLEAKSKWHKRILDSQEVLYTIQSASVDETRTRVNVLLVATYKSKYFNPRFLETFLFEKTNGRWVLKRQVVLPLHPSKPELYDVQIFISDSDWAEKRRFRRRMGRKGPDWFIDRFRKDSVDGISNDESWHTILFVFREPPPPGSKIRTEIEFDTATRPRRYTYRIEKSQPYFVLANKVRSGREMAGTVTFRIFLDDTKILEKTVPR